MLFGWLGGFPVRFFILSLAVWPTFSSTILQENDARGREGLTERRSTLKTPWHSSGLLREPYSICATQPTLNTRMTAHTHDHRHTHKHTYTHCYPLPPPCPHSISVWTLPFQGPQAPPHREDCVGLSNPSQTGLFDGVGRGGGGGGGGSGEVGWRWWWEVGGGGEVLSRSCFAKDGEVSQHKFHWYHLHQRAIKLIYYKYSSHVFTARILGPATSFKVSTCRCSGSVSVGQIGGNQKRKKRRKKRPKWEKEAMGWGVRGKGITDGGELGKHGCHCGGESEVIKIMCESIEFSFHRLTFRNKSAGGRLQLIDNTLLYQLRLGSKSFWQKACIMVQCQTLFVK